MERGHQNRVLKEKRNWPSASGKKTWDGPTAQRGNKCARGSPRGEGVESAKDAIQGDKERGKKWLWTSHEESSFKHFKIEMLMGHPEVMSTK